ASGSFVAPLLVIDLPAGAYLVRAGVCSSQVGTAPAPCRVVGSPTTAVASTPIVVDLSASPHRIGSGSTITITGAGLPPASRLNVWFDADSNSILDAGESTVPVAAPDGTFSARLLVSGQPGQYRVAVGPLVTATASSAIDIASCWFQECFIDGADT